MSEKGLKLLERAKRSQANWSSQDVERLYRAFGFDIVQKSRHTFAIHPDYPDLVGALSNHKSVKPSYVSTAVKHIETLLKRQEKEEASGSEETESDDRDRTEST